MVRKLCYFLTVAYPQVHAILLQPTLCFGKLYERLVRVAAFWHRTRVVIANNLIFNFQCHRHTRRHALSAVLISRQNKLERLSCCHAANNLYIHRLPLRSTQLYITSVHSFTTDGPAVSRKACILATYVCQLDFIAARRVDWCRTFNWQCGIDSLDNTDINCLQVRCSAIIDTYIHRSYCCRSSFRCRKLTTLVNTHTVSAGTNRISHNVIVGTNNANLSALPLNNTRRSKYNNAPRQRIDIKRTTLAKTAITKYFHKLLIVVGSNTVNFYLAF